MEGNSFAEQCYEELRMIHELYIEGSMSLEEHSELATRIIEDLEDL